MRSALSFALLSALVVTPVAAQEPDQEPRPETYGHSHHGKTFDEGPRSAAYLMPGMSTQVHFPVEGLDERAQAFFDQGITQQHGFWHFEAERSFRQVAKLHPDCAMAYWGMARANDEDAERAAGFLANAVQRSEHAPAREQMWIDAWARYYRIDDDDRKELRSGDAKRVEKAVEAIVAKNAERNKKDLDKLDQRLLKDLGTIVFEYPDDIEAKAFLAVQNWLATRWGGGLPIVSHTAVDALLDQVFAAAPLHPAHHYRIHLWDREDARRALDSARQNGSTAPTIAHQWHMSGHIYAKLHRHAEAAWQQEASARADHEHMMRDGVMPFLIHNYGHNQEWLARSLSHCGRVDEALAIARNLAELPRHPHWNAIDDGGTIASYGQRRLVQICEDHGLWQRAVDLVGQGFLEASDDVASEVERLSLLGRAFYRLGRGGDAERCATEAEQLLKKARALRASRMDAAEDEAFRERKKRSELMAEVAEAGREPTSDVQKVLDLIRELAGERLLAAGDAKAALAELQAVRGLSKPLLAGVQIAAGEVDEAIAALAKENDKQPNRIATMAALLRAYEAKLDATAAGEEREAVRAKLRELTVQCTAIAPVAFCEQHLGIGVEARPAASVVSASATAGFGADFGERPPIESIGPRTWSPRPNRGYDLPSIDGGNVSLPRSGTGRAQLVVFYLGFGCLHCVEQLHALRPLADRYRDSGIDIVAIGSNDLESTRQAHLELPENERMPFAMLADPGLEAFRAWRCHDDFEGMALHGLFLVDGSGAVRWQDISYEPFADLEWLLTEARRLLALPSAAEDR